MRLFRVLALILLVFIFVVGESYALTTNTQAHKMTKNEDIQHSNNIKITEWMFYPHRSPISQIRGRGHTIGGNV